MNYLLCTIFGYLSGSILYAYWLPKLLCGKDILANTTDGNPGTANAYKNGGFFIGTLVLTCELLKGFLPVFFAYRITTAESLLFVPVLAAPVLGHAYPFLQAKKGGKAIAVSFGVLLGLLPVWEPVVLLAVIYLSFSLVLIIDPHLFRSIATFLTFAVINCFLCPILSIRFGCAAISTIVIQKHLCKYQHEPFSMRLFRRRLL